MMVVVDKPPASESGSGAPVGAGVTVGAAVLGEVAVLVGASVLVGAPVLVGGRDGAVDPSVGVGAGELGVHW
jgi:hypothetical protein